MATEGGSRKKAPDRTKSGATRRAKSGKGRTGAGSDGLVDLEAVGLVLLGLGLFSLVLLVPRVPTGQMGEGFRTMIGGRIGWAAWALPWPLLALGGLFLVRKSPPAWPRVLAGYLLTAAGAWAVIALALPGDLGGGGLWGDALRAPLAGAAGRLALLPALLVVALGIEIVMGWRPLRILRGVLVRAVSGLGRGGRAALAARARARERAAFHADVALARRALTELDGDLEALRVLYPGSSELERWRREVAASRQSLARPTEEALDEARRDADAWRGAVDGFARDRALELKTHLKTEGSSDFDAWARGVKAQLDDPVDDAVRIARPLDDVRKTLALDLTALAERHRRLARERDLAEAAIEGMTPRQLARASREHVARLAEHKAIREDAERLEADADGLEPWRDLSARLLRAVGEFPQDEELIDYAGTLAGELRERGRDLLPQIEGWSDALEAVELRARRRALEAARAPAPVEAGEGEGEGPPAPPRGPGAGEAGAGGSGAHDARDPGTRDPFGAFADADDELDGLDGLGAAPAEEGASAGDPGSADADAPSGDDLDAFDPHAAPQRVRVDPAAAAARTADRSDVPPWEDAPEAPVLPVGAGGEDLSGALGGDGEDGGEGATPEVGGIPIQLPDLDLLDAPAPDADDPAGQAREVQERVRKIDETLSNFRLEGRVVSSVRGPTVTRFEVEPAPGEKISRFANLSDDLALAMAVGSVRIEAPIPGKSVIGLEVPNADRDLIRFRQAVSAPTFRRAKARLPMILGKSIDGEMVVADLARMPHLLIAGSTGSGKSVAVNTLIGSLLYKYLPTELRFLMIDPKMVELTPYDGIPHLLRPVVTNPNDASGVLLGAVAHMERRYKMMSKIGAKNLDQYNEKARNLDMPEMPFIVIIIDELADLMITSPKEVESAIMRLAQMARATGMHLILATQRPSVDILTSLIKVNVPARMAFAVSSSHDSRTILDSMGAERLVGMGDMLYYQPGLSKPVRLQGPFVDEPEIHRLASFLRRQYFDDDFVDAYGTDFDPPSLHESDASGLIDWNDDKLREAAELVINEGQASVSRLQRRLQVGHARAGKLMDSLEALAVVGPHQGSKPREVLVELEELPNIFGK